MVKKTVKCPRCKKVFLCTGKEGDVLEVTCPSCSLHGKVTFKKSEYLVEAIDVHKVYRGSNFEVHALKGVTLGIKKGEIVVFMGVSGCGKTTLLNCLSGLDEVTSGTVRIGGRDVRSMSDDERTGYRARNIGFIFQFYNLLPVLSVVENVELPLLLAGRETAAARKRAFDVLKMVGLEGHEMKKPAELSGGQRQRVAIARAIVNRPLIVFGDEPTGDLDRETSEEIMDLICELNRRDNQTFVLVTHDVNIADRAHRVFLMGSGVIKKEYVPARWWVKQ